MYYIYIYLDPRKPGKHKYGEYEFDYKPFYVGKGKDRRLKIINGRTQFFENKINKIKSLEIKPIIIKLYENLSEEQSFELETKLIKEIGRVDLRTGPLINMTIGGEGSSGRIVLEKTLKKLRKNYQDIKNEFEKRKYILLTEFKEYKNAHNTKLNYICPRGHDGSINWSNFQQRQGCEICNIEKRRKNYQDIKKEFEKRNYILLTEEKDYKNSKQKLNYICPEGHESSICWNNFKKIQDCSICWRKSLSKNIGEKSPNHKLTEEQVIQIKLLLKEGILTQQEIADMFGVSRRTISNIKRGIVWSNIEV
jgi:predicted XRE-type DNA-binding protein